MKHLHNLIQYTYKDEYDFLLECLDEKEAERFAKLNLDSKIRYLKHKDLTNLIFYDILKVMKEHNISLHDF